MRLCALIILFIFCPLQAMSAEIVAHGLTQSYSRDKRVCEEAAALLTDDKACRHFDAINCTDEEKHSVLVRGVQLDVFEEITTNQYGYSQIYRAIGSSLKGFAIVYVQKQYTDCRLLETWKVNAVELDDLLKLPPGPNAYKQWIEMLSQMPMSKDSVEFNERMKRDEEIKETNAVEFNAMLKRGEKLTDEWSPIIDIYGEPYVIERECAGRCAYGGFYACNKVIKLTVKKLFKDKKAVPYCQYSKAKKK